MWSRSHKFTADATADIQRDGAARSPLKEKGTMSDSIPQRDPRYLQRVLVAEMQRLTEEAHEIAEDIRHKTDHLVALEGSDLKEVGKISAAQEGSQAVNVKLR
jgi:hypothetical protein